MEPRSVMPAEAGIQGQATCGFSWIPASAGMTSNDSISSKPALVLRPRVGTGNTFAVAVFSKLSRYSLWNQDRDLKCKVAFRYGDPLKLNRR
jgi:hypothetical protein